MGMPGKRLQPRGTEQLPLYPCRASAPSATANPIRSVHSKSWTLAEYSCSPSRVFRFRPVSCLQLRWPNRSLKAWTYLSIIRQTGCGCRAGSLLPYLRPMSMATLETEPQSSPLRLTPAPMAVRPGDELSILARQPLEGQKHTLTAVVGSPRGEVARSIAEVPHSTLL